MARCGWCNRTGLTNGDVAATLERHTIPRGIGVSPCKGYETYVSLETRPIPSPKK